MSRNFLLLITFLFFLVTACKKKDKTPVITNNVFGTFVRYTASGADSVRIYHAGDSVRIKSYSIGFDYAILSTDTNNYGVLLNCTAECTYYAPSINSPLFMQGNFLKYESTAINGDKNKLWVWLTPNASENFEGYKTHD